MRNKGGGKTTKFERGGNGIQWTNSEMKYTFPFPASLTSDVGRLHLAKVNY